jgi:hypothetical protein
MGCLGRVSHDANIREEVKSMTQEEARSDDAEQGKRPRYQVRLPGFITDEEIGLGDVIKRATYAMGMKPCGGCERRAAALNRWVGFSRRSSH